jgi:hypothetical protein
MDIQFQTQPREEDRNAEGADESPEERSEEDDDETNEEEGDPDENEPRFAYVDLPSVS